MTTSRTAHPTEGEIEQIVRAFDEAWLPEPQTSQLRTEWANYDRSKNDPAHPNRVSSKRWRDHRVACMRAALATQPSRPQGEEGLWRPIGEAREDLHSHRLAWRHALELAIERADHPTDDADDRSYWRHELTVFDRVFTALSNQGEPSS